MKKIIALAMGILMLVLSLSLTSCDKTPYEKSDAETNLVLIDVKGYGKIVVELYPDVAPITVANFKKLVSEGVYDGLTFHRVVKGFMIQGGDPKGNGTGGSDTEITGEFSANGIENKLSHTRGVISMARSQEMNSASSQFFIMHADYTGLDGNYAAFGKVVYGLEVVDAIAEVKTKFNSYGSEKSVPTEKVIMEKVYFVTPKN